MKSDILVKCVFLACVIGTTIIVFYDFLFVSHNFSSFEVLFLFYVFYSGLLLPFIFIDHIEENYGILSEIHMFSTYQYRRILFTCWFSTLACLIVGCSHLLGFFDKGLLCSAFFIIPILSLLLGVNVFNDSSCIVNDEILLGYPTIYPLISLILGIFGFSFILNSNINSTIILIIIFIFQIILVLPHVFNKFVPFEIRTKKGCLYFLISCILCYALLIFLLMGGNMFSSTDDLVNPARILKNVLIYGGGMLLVILFYKQAKDMNEKKK